MRIKLRIHEGPAHDEVTVFVGPDIEHFANAGSLTLRHDEADEFVNAFSIGADVVVERIPDPA